jgi:hypothetical protein
VLLLKDQYQLTAPFIHYKKKIAFSLKVQVNNLAPLERFMKGVDEARNL